MNLIKNAPFGFAHHEIILSQEGTPIDYRFLETNPAFEKLTGLDSQKILGKTICEIRPDIQKKSVDWITVYGKVALEGGSKTFQYYSEPLKRWYSVQVYSPEKGYFTAIFSEITPNKIIEEAASKFNDFTPANIDYQYLTDQARKLSGAKYAVFNQFDENGKNFSTMGFSGMDRHIEKAVSMLGFDFRNKKWPHDAARENLIKTHQTTCFSHLKELTGTTIPVRVVEWLCQTFQVKSAAVIKAQKDGILIGDFTLLFAPGSTLQHQETMELYANLTGMLIMRIETEKKFRQNHERLALAMDAGEQGFWDWNLETGDVFFSPQYYSMLGYQNRELPRQIETWTNLIHPEDKKNVLPVIQNHIKRGETYQIEFRMKCKNGTYKWISAQGRSFLKDKKGKPYRAVGLHVDIDMRKKNQERIYHLSRIVEQAGDAIIETGTDFKITYMNRAAEQQTGYSLKEVKGKKVTMLSARPEDEQHTALFKSLQNKNSTEQRYFNKKKNGEEYISSATITPIADSKGNHAGYVSFQRDITDQIAVRKQLKAQKEQFELAVNGTNDGIWDWNITTGELFLSKQWKAMLGYEDHELKNEFSTFFSLIYHEDKERVTHYVQQYMEGKTRPYSIEFRMVHKNNSSRWILAKGKALRDEKGIPYRMAGSHSDITLRKQTEERLRTNENNFRNFFETMEEMIFIGNKQGEIIDTNQAVTKILGYSREVLKGKPLLQIHPPRNQHKAKKILEDMVAGKRFGGPLPLQRKDGMEIPTQTHVWWGQWNGEECLFGISKNLSKEQEALQKFNKIFESNPTPMAIISLPDRKFHDVNQAFQKKFGFQKKEITGKTNKSINLFKDPGMHKKISQQLERTGKIHQKELQIKSKSGKIITGLYSGEIIESLGKHFLLSVFTDITLQKNAEQAFRESEEKVAKIGNAALDAVIMINEKGKIEYWNKAATNIFGFSEKKMMGRDVHQLLMSEKYKNAYETAWEQFQKTGEGPAVGKLIEMEAKTANETTIPIEMALSPITVKNKIWALAYIRDISTRKIAEKELVEARNLAENANRAKSEFLANMSHEIRTPMNSILGFSEIMLNTTQDPKQKSYLKTILDSGKTLLSLINDILDLSKIEAGRMDVSPEPTNLRSIIREMEQLFHHKLQEKNLDFIIEIDNDLPPAILIDEVRLQQILLNLIGNAIKFTPEGFVKTEINILNLTDESIDFEIAVSDSGIGIPEEEHQTIFNSFSQQSGQDTKQYGGTGLGLAISKRLIELMNASIGVKSSPGKGSRFTLTFSEIKFFNEISEKEDIYAWDEENIIFEGSKILIVDDVPHNRKLATTYLNQYDLSLFEAENGATAVKMAEAHLPDLILMDIRMPVINGYEATKKIKQLKKTAHIPVVALTASTMQSEIKKINQLFDGYLRKPARKKALVNEMARHLPFKEKQAEKPGPGESPQRGQKTLAPIAPEVRKIFKHTFEEAIQKQTSMMVIDQLYDTAEKLDNFASEYQISPLKEKIKKLRLHLEGFEIDGIQDELNEIINLFN